MHLSVATCSLLALLFSQAYAQSPSATSNANPGDTDGGIEDVVEYILPSATITSISPAQSSALLSNANAYFSDFTASNPVSDLQANIIGDSIFAETRPSEAQQSQMVALLNNVQSGLLADPSGYISSVDALVSPFPFASDIKSYETAFLAGLQTVVASDLSMPVPTAPAQSTSTGGVPAVRATGCAQVVVGAVAAAAGVVGVGML